MLRDFNACLGAHEKIGRPPLPISCCEFTIAIDDCDLSTLDTIGALYTWIGRDGLDMVQVQLYGLSVPVPVLILGRVFIARLYLGIAQIIILCFFFVWSMVLFLHFLGFEICRRRIRISYPLSRMSGQRLLFLVLRCGL